MKFGLGCGAEEGWAGFGVVGESWAPELGCHVSKAGRSAVLVAHRGVSPLTGEASGSPQVPGSLDTPTPCSAAAPSVCSFSIDSLIMSLISVKDIGPSCSEACLCI